MCILLEKNCFMLFKGSVLELYLSHQDIGVFLVLAVCDTCSGRVKLEPSKWLVGMDFDSDTGIKLAFSKVDIAQTCAEIVTGTADCSHEEADPASRNVISSTYSALVTP